MIIPVISYAQTLTTRAHWLDTKMMYSPLQMCARSIIFPTQLSVLGRAMELIFGYFLQSLFPHYRLESWAMLFLPKLCDVKVHFRSNRMIVYFLIKTPSPKAVWAILLLCHFKVERAKRGIAYS